MKTWVDKIRYLNLGLVKENNTLVQANISKFNVINPLNASRT